MPNDERAAPIFARWLADRASVSIDALYEAHPDLALELCALHAEWLDGVHNAEGAGWLRARLRRRLVLRAGAWAAVVVVAAAIPLYVLGYVQDAASFKPPDPHAVRAVLEGTPVLEAREVDLVAYEDVLDGFLFNWTPTARTADFSELLRVLSVDEPAEVEYTLESGQRAVCSLRVGESLPAPFEHVRIAVIWKKGVVLQLEEPLEHVWLPVSGD